MLYNNLSSVLKREHLLQQKFKIEKKWRKMLKEINKSKMGHTLHGWKGESKIANRHPFIHWYNHRSRWSFVFTHLVTRTHSITHSLTHPCILSSCTPWHLDWPVHFQCNVAGPSHHNRFWNIPQSRKHNRRRGHRPIRNSSIVWPTLEGKRKLKQSLAWYP